MTVTSDEAVLKVLGDRPATTHQIRTLLAHKAGISYDEVPIYRLRRTLDRLEARGAIVGSGGPVRASLPDWPNADARDVQWATKKVAERIAEEHQEHLDLKQSIKRERESLLRGLHRVLRPFERETLGLTNIPARIKEGLPSPAEWRHLHEFDPMAYGPLGMEIDQLRVVAGSIIECRE
jgi:hypothetical protein